MRFLPVLLSLCVAVACNGSGCSAARRQLVSLFSPSYDPPENPDGFAPAFDGADAARPRIAVRLVPVAEGFEQITDLQFVPGHEGLLAVLEKEGRATLVSLPERKRAAWFERDVVADSEAGLLGLAFHPRFAENGRFFVNFVVRKNGDDVSRVSEWTADPQVPHAGAEERRVLLEVKQPYANHNAGQLAFGPDGYLYVGWGDGGWMDDPHGNGQNTETMLGAMLRIDVDRQEDGKPYGIPRDNPFVGEPGFLPEIWAYGLRNPWRYSFDERGRLVVADVGQGQWEEVSLAPKGANLGWSVREGRHCFRPQENCPVEGLTDPVYEYDHDEGSSITGGYVYLGDEISALRGKYVFGDFLSGRLWAIELPAEAGHPVSAATLGRWPILPSTFGRDAAGNLYVGGFTPGVVYRIEPGEGAD